MKHILEMLNDALCHVEDVARNDECCHVESSQRLRVAARQISDAINSIAIEAMSTNSL